MVKDVSDRHQAEHIVAETGFQCEKEYVALTAQFFHDR
jgi:hypothetical protein